MTFMDSLRLLIPILALLGMAATYLSYKTNKTSAENNAQDKANELSPSRSLEADEPTAIEAYYGITIADHKVYSLEGLPQIFTYEVNGGVSGQYATINDLKLHLAEELYEHITPGDSSQILAIFHDQQFYPIAINGQWDVVTNQAEKRNLAAGAEHLASGNKGEVIGTNLTVLGKRTITDQELHLVKPNKMGARFIGWLLFAVAVFYIVYVYNKAEITSLWYVLTLPAALLCCYLYMSVKWLKNNSHQAPDVVMLKGTVNSFLINTNDTSMLELAFSDTQSSGNSICYTIPATWASDDLIDRSVTLEVAQLNNQPAVTLALNHHRLQHDPAAAKQASYHHAVFFVMLSIIFATISFSTPWAEGLSFIRQTSGLAINHQVHKAAEFEQRDFIAGDTLSYDGDWLCIVPAPESRQDLCEAIALTKTPENLEIDPNITEFLAAMDSQLLFPKNSIRQKLRIHQYLRNSRQQFKPAITNMILLDNYRFQQIGLLIDKTCDNSTSCNDIRKTLIAAYKSSVSLRGGAGSDEQHWQSLLKGKRYVSYITGRYMSHYAEVMKAHQLKLQQQLFTQLNGSSNNTAPSFSLAWPETPPQVKALQLQLHQLKTNYSESKLAKFKQSLASISAMTSIKASYIRQDSNSILQFTQPLNTTQTYWIRCLVGSFMLSMLAYFFHTLRFFRASRKVTKQ